MVIEAGSLYLVQHEGQHPTYQTEDLIFKVYVKDQTGAGVKLVWFWRPETITMLAMKNLDTVVAIDLHGYTYTGQRVLNLIIQSKKNDYSIVQD
tara:strand:- start:4453 stop:4734 length:282 start_codon:yes stop_codon:yes gene_type:complete